ncbi:MAG: ShlB/FhaC/HecB family hemolysin secretion/activation protein [bacterium]
MQRGNRLTRGSAGAGEGVFLCLAALMFILHVIAPPGAASAFWGYSCPDKDAATGMSRAEEPISEQTLMPLRGATKHENTILFSEQKLSIQDLTPNPAGETGALSHLSRVYVKRIDLLGNTVFSKEECAALTACYENREITSEELQDLREALTRFYRQRGYVTSWVIIPDQEVHDGVVRLQAVEGRIAGIVVEGNTRFRTGFIAGRLRRSSGPPVNALDLQAALARLDNDPRIRHINALLGPGLREGEGILYAQIEEAAPYALDFGACNCRPPGVGPERAWIHAAHRNLTGNGDVIEGTLGKTEGATDADLSYTIPLTARDSTLKLSFRESDTLVIEEPFHELDIRGKDTTWGCILSHSVYRGSGRELSLSLAAEVRRSRTFLLGRPFSFTDGAEEGRTRLKVVRFAQQWNDRSNANAFAVRSCFSLGEDALAGTWESDREDGAFCAWLGQIQWVRRLGDRGTVVVLRGDVQLANDPLLPFERFAVGGMNSVRGYRENRLVRDNGLASSVEVRIPIISNHRGEAPLQAATFLDYGRSWNTNTPTPEPTSLSSIGIGIRGLIAGRISLAVYWGIPLRDLPVTERDIQDDGIHVQIEGRVL